MQVFFDTEFTSLEPNQMRRLISIGCVSQDGQEFYAELTDTWDDSMCSPFVLDAVVPLLQGGGFAMGVDMLAGRLKVWLESLADKQVVMRSDAPEVDWHFVREIFDGHGWPANLRRTCGGIYLNHDCQIRRYQDAMTEYWRGNSDRQHHALVDARSLLFAWKSATKRGM